MSKDPCAKGHLGSTWIRYDGRGIPLCKVCEHCEEFKMARYNPIILNYYTQEDVDEPIGDEPYDDF